VTSQLEPNTKQQLSSAKELSASAMSNLLEELAKCDRKQLEEQIPTGLRSLRESCFKYVDGLLWWIIIGTVVGARLGHVFFYEWPYYSEHWMAILKIWEGGLASHGGTIGVLLATYSYSRWHKRQFPEINFLTLLDLMTIPTACCVIFIRIGNFVNQEILGTPSNMPWAVLFLHPADGSPLVARHPVQLYEALAYLLTFGLLLTLWKLKNEKWQPGRMAGLFFICIFGSRFCLEFFKTSQSQMIDESFWQMGQLLSLPFIALGAALIIFSLSRRNHDNHLKERQQ
jgi:prolipoprotein diacylglyceryl transferase